MVAAGRLERQDYEDFLKAFGQDQDLLVSWEGCTVDDERLIAFRDRINQKLGGEDSLFASVETTNNVLNHLTHSPLNLSYDEAIERLKGFVIGADGTAAIFIRVTELGVRQQARTVEQILTIGDQIENLGREQLRLTGTVFETYAVDQAAESSLVRLVPPSSILGLLVAWFCLRSLRLAVCVLLIAGMGQLLAVALVYFTGRQFSAVLIVLPTLVFMLTLSGAVHLINYYRDMQRIGIRNASFHAVRVGWIPCSLSSITTVLGMGSLWTSQIGPVREFGLFSGVALMLATIVLLLVFPTFVEIFSWRMSTTDRDLPSETAVHSLPSWVLSYVRWIARHASSIALASMLVMIASFWGVSQLKASTKFTDMFPIRSKVNQDMLWIEEHLGPISTIEVLLVFPPDSKLTSFDRLRYLAEVSRALKDVPEVGGVLSAVTFVPSWSEKSSLGAVAKRNAVRKSVEENIERLREEKWVGVTDRGETWRLMAKVSATSKQDYGTLVSIVEEACSKVLATPLLEKKLSIHYTGLTPIMHQTQVTLLKDLGYSFLTAFLLITPIMMWVTRSFLGGLIAMIPNVLPISLVFGVMGWLGFTLDIAGILTASIALGIAVDDTLHFLCRYMSNIDSQNARFESTCDTFRVCSAAMIHTTVIACLSMAPFLLAGFLPTQQFAKLMIAMLCLAIIGDLLVLPALLLSPMGLVIRSVGSKSAVSIH